MKKNKRKNKINARKKYLKPAELNILNLILLTGRKTIHLVRPILTFLEIVGKITQTIGFVVLKFLSFYLSRVKRTITRVLLLIQFIGETTLVVGFVFTIVVKNLISYFFASKPKKKIKLDKFLTIGRKTLKKLPSFAIKLRRPSYSALSFALAVILIWGIYYFTFIKDLPSPYNLERSPLPQSSRVLDKNGNLLFLAYNGKINRVWLDLNQIPDNIKKATLAVEDQDFYYHRGISLRGIARAIVNNIENKSTQGGSTITQQLVKIALLKDNRRVISRKVKEAYLSLLVERAYSKDQILEFYLNNAPYGGTAYGVEAGARKYFGKEASQLNLSEAALLASLPTAPSLKSPYSSKEETYKKNQKQVLDSMVKAGFISPHVADEAYNQKLAFYSIDNQILAPHFVFWVLDQLESSMGKKLVQEGGLDITTTLDLAVQLKAEQIVKENIEKLEKPYWISNGSALVTQPQSGKILAMVGSRDYFNEAHDGKVNVTVSRRQPGSSIKVVNYAYALSKGGFTPSTIVDDSPVTYKNDWETYSPKNYDGKYRGSVTIKQALAMSLNVPAVKVLNSYGPEKMVELGIQMGIDSWKDLKGYGLSLTLGAGEVKMTELATVYGTLMNLGQRKDLYAVEKIVNHKKKVLADAQIIKENKVLGVSKVFAQNNSDENVLPQYTAFQLTNILSDNAARLPAFGPYAKLEIPGHKVAVKTGTTNNIRDNWTVGYNPDYLVATWVGNNDNRPMNPNLTSGITGAAPIWNEIMSYLLTDSPPEDYATPSGMIKIKVCAVNGLLTCPRCPKEIEEYFVPGTEPKTQCSFPTAQDCGNRKKQMESENKSADEINKALVNCPTGSTN